MRRPFAKSCAVTGTVENEEIVAIPMLVLKTSTSPSIVCTCFVVLDIRLTFDIELLISLFDRDTFQANLGLCVRVMSTNLDFRIIVNLFCRRLFLPVKQHIFPSKIIKEQKGWTCG